MPVGRFSFGQIILAYFSDGKGRTKERPCVIISSNTSNDSGEPLQVVAITGVFDEPPPSHHVPLPWTRDGSGPTGLNKPCVAKCNWLREVDQHKVIKSVGYLPAEMVDRIVVEFDRLYEDESFTEWV
jgi:mRNA-degrading endonuclease toxin of MazEF toxin-antitoxin module